MPDRVQPERDPAILELYKLAVEMSDRVSARRGTANTFYLTVQTAFVSALGLSASTLHNTSDLGRLVVCLAGAAISVSWWLQLRSYRDLNKAKFSVINKIELDLPLQIFSDEWNSLKRDPIPGWRGRYAELGSVERFIPLIFVVLYALLAARG